MASYSQSDFQDPQQENRKWPEVLQASLSLLKPEDPSDSDLEQKLQLWRDTQAASVFPDNLARQLVEKESERKS